MANGYQKPVQAIKRGDLVAGNLSRTISYKVARLITDDVGKITPKSIVKIAANSIGLNQPNRDTIMTGNHPILHEGIRRYAGCYREYPGVSYHKRGAQTVDILPANDNGTHSLYNIQFEHDGYYVANGLVVDSVPVNSNVRPLPKEMYFNKELINRPSTIIVAPVDKRTILQPIKYNERILPNNVNCIHN